MVNKGQLKQAHGDINQPYEKREQRLLQVQSIRACACPFSTLAPLAPRFEMVVSWRSVSKQLLVVA
jgi:hypothetical protein